MTWGRPVKVEEGELPAGIELDGQYRIRSVLGEGGMGTVYLAEDLERSHDVALKILIPRYRGRPEREQRLLNEAKLGRRVGEHPNLPRLLGAGRLRDLAGCPYVAWEAVQGLDLNALLALRRTIPPRVAVRWSRQLADALCTMHRAGVVHRDVTVTNVFIEHPDDDPHVKLIDLSHAAILPRPGVSHSRITRELEVPGAHRFMPPEQAMAAPPHPKMDVFSFGVVLYEMLTGRNPFRHVQHREAYIELQRAGELHVAPIDRRVYPHVPESLVELVVACTHNEVERRLEMAEVLQRLDALRPQMAPPVLVAADEAEVGDGEATGPSEPEPEVEVEAETTTDPIECAPDRSEVATEPQGVPASAERTTASVGASVEPSGARRTRARGARRLVIAAAAMMVLTVTVAAVLLVMGEASEPAAAAPAEPAPPREPSLEPIGGRAAWPTAEPVPREPGELERVEPEPPEPQGEPEPPEPEPAQPEPAQPPPEPAAAEPASAGPASPTEPEDRGESRRRRPPRSRTPVPETDACRRTVADALRADKSHAWGRLEALTRKPKCFEDRALWAELRVRALLETEHFEECAALAKTFQTRVVQKYASICRAQEGSP